MPLLKQTMTMDSVFTLIRARTRDDRPPGVMAYLREELPAGVNSVPLAAYAFMSGYLNAISFITSTIWCGFMTGNSVMLGLALARVSLGQRREDAFAVNDAQAFTALFCFVIGIALARVGDCSFWAGSTSSDPEKGLKEIKSRRSSVDWADSAPTRVGTPTLGANGKPRLVVPSGPSGSSPSPSPSPVKESGSPVKSSPTPTSTAPARTRLWLLTGTLFQALVLVGSGLASKYDPRHGGARWSSPVGFVALGLASLSMGVQGVMAHRMGSGFGATVVLSSLWVEMVGSPGGIRWKEYRGVRVYTILLFIVGGLVGGILRDPKVLGVSNALFVGAGMRVLIAVGWLFVQA